VGRCSVARDFSFFWLAIFLFSKIGFAILSSGSKMQFYRIPLNDNLTLSPCSLSPAPVPEKLQQDRRRRLQPGLIPSGLRLGIAGNILGNFLFGIRVPALSDRAPAVAHFLVIGGVHRCMKWWTDDAFCAILLLSTKRLDQQSFRSRGARRQIKIAISLLDFFTFP